jgi:hypothetical protein
MKGMTENIVLFSKPTNIVTRMDDNKLSAGLDNARSKSVLHIDDMVQEIMLQSKPINIITQLSGLSLPFGDINRIELGLKFKTAYNGNTYSEIIREDGYITQIDIWDNSSKDVKLFTQLIIREDGNIIETVITDEITGKTLTSTIVRTDGLITGIIKNYS